MYQKQKKKKKKHQGVFNNRVLLHFSKKDRKKEDVNNFVAIEENQYNMGEKDWNF